MTTKHNPSPAKPEQTLNRILDEIADYLPNECAGLNHNDLPETKAAIQRLVKSAIGSSETGLPMTDKRRNVLAQQYDRNIRNDLRDQIRENCKRVGLLP